MATAQSTISVVPTATTRTVGNPPPDPGSVAPPVQPDVATSLFSSTQFLYSGSNPIQTGMSPGTIEQLRTAVLRGGVMTQNGQPLASVTVSIQGHPEYGQTLSRADGRFDLVVNGGASVVLNYTRAGFIHAQPQLNVARHGFAYVPSVAPSPM